MDGYKSLEINSKRQQIHFLPGTRKNSKLLYCFFSDLRKIKMPVTITTPTQRGKKSSLSPLLMMQTKQKLFFSEDA